MMIMDSVEAELTADVIGATTGAAVPLDKTTNKAAIIPAVIPTAIDTLRQGTVLCLMLISFNNPLSCHPKSSILYFTVVVKKNKT